MVAFVGHQHVLQLFLLVMHEVENKIDVKVFVLDYVDVPTRLKVDYTSILIFFPVGFKT